MQPTHRVSCSGPDRPFRKADRWNRNQGQAPSVRFLSMGSTSTLDYVSLTEVVGSATVLPPERSPMRELAMRRVPLFLALLLALLVPAAGAKASGRSSRTPIRGAR